MKWDGIDKKMAAVDPDIRIEVCWVPTSNGGGEEQVYASDRAVDAWSRKLHEWPADKFVSSDECVSKVKAFIDGLRNIKKLSDAAKTVALASERERSKVWFG